MGLEVTWLRVCLFIVVERVCGCAAAAAARFLVFACSTGGLSREEKTDSKQGGE